ncbi:alpha-L-fucosidase [Harmonia axyridis]|uniref:alpha-L-fucosidase n=1 Tax=Harmonia axyridis TaxID=115357 RepID=UPI001E276A1C|nr:alpha-L-fucosidase [Harmonia axyridis]
MKSTGRRVSHCCCNCHIVKMRAFLSILLILIFVTISTKCNIPRTVNSFDVKYEPNWNSLDSRPLPKWYDEAKIGIFIHWGVFSVPSFGSEWFWADWKSNSSKYVDYVNNNLPKGFSYQEFAKDFKAEFFNPKEWAELFKKSGAKYVVLTSKHHEGFTLWPSKYSFSWNAKDIGPHRDLVGDLSREVREAGLTFGLYHSLYEWFNPMYLSDKTSKFTSTEFIDKKIIPEMKEIVEKYKPDVLWSDGDWEAKDSYWKSTEFLAWLYNESPVKDTIVVNDRWGIDIPCKHGDFFTCTDRYNPGTLQKHKWENAMTLDKESWGFRRNAPLKDYLTIHELLETLAQTISCGGNLLVNVGPTKEGTIAPIFEERLKDLGSWLKINGEAIYGSKPWTYQNDTLTSGVWFTRNSEAIYAIVLNWPEGNLLRLKAVKEEFDTSSVTLVKMLGNNDNLKWYSTVTSIDISFPDKAKVKSRHAWVLKIKNSK